MQRGTEKKSLREAQQAGWIEDYAWGWDGSAYRLVYDASVVPQAEGRLEPWKGYWVYAHQDCALLLPPPPQGEGSRQSAACEGRQLDGAVGGSSRRRAGGGSDAGRGAPTGRSET